MVKILKAIISWFEDSDRAALDRYLGQAQNYAELKTECVSGKTKAHSYKTLKGDFKYRLFYST